MFFQLRRDGIVGEIILAGDDDAGRVHIDPVDDPRAQNPVDPGEIFLTMVHQRIHQSPCVMSCCRMDHHALRLVHQDHIVILI